jgi:hypothetical protein
MVHSADPDRRCSQKRRGSKLRAGREREPDNPRPQSGDPRWRGNDDPHWEAGELGGPDLAGPPSWYADPPSWYAAESHWPDPDDAGWQSLPYAELHRGGGGD